MRPRDVGRVPQTITSTRKEGVDDFGDSVVTEERVSMLTTTRDLYGVMRVSESCPPRDCTGDGDGGQQVGNSTTHSCKRHDKVS